MRFNDPQVEKEIASFTTLQPPGAVRDELEKQMRLLLDELEDLFVPPDATVDQWRFWTLGILRKIHEQALRLRAKKEK